MYAMPMTQCHEDQVAQSYICLFSTSSQVLTVAVASCKPQSHKPAFSRTATLLAKEKTLKHIFDAQYDDPESSHHFDGCAYVLEVHYRVIYRSFTRIWETGHDAC